MAGSLNKVMLIGNLGNDPEVRSTQDGRSLCTFSIATTESWKDKNSGERRDKTEWHRIVIFNEGLVRIAEQYLKKGSKVFLEGQLQTRKWEDKEGNIRYFNSIQGWKIESENQGINQETPNEAESQESDDSDLPF